MTWPAVTPTATWDRTSGTEGRSVDAVLHPMLVAKSQWLSALKVGAQVDEPKIEWISANTVGRTFTAAATNTPASGVGYGGVRGAASGSASNVLIGGCTTGIGALLKPGAIIKNASGTTPTGTYGLDEIMLVTVAPDGNGDITVRRDYGRQNSGTGSAYHAPTDVYEVLFMGIEEGSSPSGNRYKATTVSENYTTILDFYMTVTGSEMARRPQIAADNMQRQYEDRVIELKNDLSSMTLYGALSYGGNAGSDSYARTTKGLAQALVQSTGNVDYTSTALSEDAINKLFETILSNGCERTDPYKILVNPAQARVMSSFGADKIRIERVDQTWGRYVTVFLSDLGFEAEIIADPLVSKGNLFIVNMNKVELIPFRPWTKLEWGIDTSTPDGTDAYKMRVLGEYTFKCIDPLKAHGAMTTLTWPS